MLNNTINRLNSDGSFDTSFITPNTLSSVSTWVVDAAGKIVLFGTFSENGYQVARYARLNLDGSLDNSFNPLVELGATISVLGLGSNGKIIVAGDFSRINGLPRSRLARLNTDGTTDVSFDAGSGFDNDIYKIAVQTDGKVLIGGDFNNFNGTQHVGIVRLNSNGSVDAAFNPVLEAGGSVINAIALQPDGKILIGGLFANINGTSRSGLARLNPDGSLDTSFNVMLGVAAAVRSILVQTDGKIMIGGSFNGVNGFSRTNLARLNSNGSLDTTFNAGNISVVNQIEVQPDGKYLVLSSTLVRLNNNGAADSSFQVPTFSNGFIYTFVLQADGTVIIGGDFTITNTSRSNIARLATNGSVDPSFIPNGADNIVRAIVKQTDEKIVIGGNFTRVSDAVRLGIARIISSSIPHGVLFDFDGDGRADISLFRPATNTWYRLNSSNNTLFQQIFGGASDLIAPADYDGDGKADLAIFRPAPGLASSFLIIDSSTNTLRQINFALSGDLPICGDWDGDGKADIAVYRSEASGNQSHFYYRPSGSPGVNFLTIQWGTTGDKPVVADYDGDGRTDAAIFRPSTGEWYILQSANNQIRYYNWGLSNDFPTPADYDGDGRADVAIYRPSSGAWYILQSTNSSQYSYYQWGLSGDIPAAADYDGDGKADVVVFRPASGVWYLLNSSSGFRSVQFGANNDRPIPAAYTY